MLKIGFMIMVSIAFLLIGIASICEAVIMIKEAGNWMMGLIVIGLALILCALPLAIMAVMMGW